MDTRVLRAQKAKRARREAWRHRWDFWKRIAFQEFFRVLTRALESGYNAPTLGSELRVEALDSVMQLVTFSSSRLKLAPPPPPGSEL